MGPRVQLDQADDDAPRRNEWLPARRLLRHLHLSADSGSLVAAGTLDRLQIREGLRAGWLRAGKIAAMLVVLALIVRSIARNWAAFQSVHVTLDANIGWLAASVAVVFLTYAIQIESWRCMLRGWDQHLSYTKAVR